MGRGSRGSWVSSLMGQMGHGSQNRTHCQLWSHGHGQFTGRGTNCAETEIDQLVSAWETHVDAAK